MTSLCIEICNERLLPRFGVDRLLVLLARRLAESGHDVAFSCLRCDKTMLTPITKNISVLQIPEGLNMAETEEAAMSAMAQRWQNRRPDVLVSGGWPFFEAAARAERFGIKSVFIDAGAVAQDDLLDPLLSMQRELRRIRQLTLPSINRVLPISDFIRLTQTEPDRGCNVGVRTVLLGSDHMSLGTFGNDQQEQRRDLFDSLDARLQRGERLLLALGRFELRGYKNSPAAYGLLRLIKEQVPEACLLVLDAGQDCGVPADLKSCVDLIGAPNDHTLQEIMRRCAAGLSLSLWEGFNLPLAEMQWLGRPAFAFNVGAHPEVVADPWLLCENVAEMAVKVVMLLRGQVPLDLAPRFAAFRERQRWEITLAAWEDEIVKVAGKPRVAVEIAECGREARRIVLADVTNASLDPANPGVVRVARRLCSELQQHPGLELVFAAWSRDLGGYIFLDQTRRDFLEGFGGPRDGLGILATYNRQMTPSQLIASIAHGRLRAPVLFLPEVMFDGQAMTRASWARARGFKSAALVYDLIPVFHHELCDPNITAGFPGYLEALVQADAVWSISDFTLKDLSRYVANRGQTMPRVCETICLPGQFGEYARCDTHNPGISEKEIRILCVSTLEPRKNHLRLLKAFQMVRAHRGDLPLQLVLIGNRYAGSPEIAEQVQASSRRDSRIEWHGAADDACLAREFERATFTVYPSLVEGFGLPILESLWMGCPCLTHDGGVMRELAVGGGCMMVDMTDPSAIMRSLERLATDQSLLAKLQQEARVRRIITWREYAEDVAARLLKL
jgi:glycosyltransferase involved in cell wall biosynthesis